VATDRPASMAASLAASHDRQVVDGCEANRNHDSRLPERAVKLICEEHQHYKGKSFMG
jgi:hypothetical protein